MASGKKRPAKVAPPAPGRSKKTIAGRDAVTARPADDRTSRAARPAAWQKRVPGRQEQRELKEQVLYETAAHWFNKHGYHGTSLTDLASDLGITKASLYNYVADKRELLYKVHVRSIEAAKAAQDQAMAETTWLGKIRKMVFNYVSAITRSPMVTFIVLEDGALAPEQAEEILAARSALDHEFRRWIAAGIRDRSIVPCDPKLVSFLITGGLAWITKWYDPDGPWTGEQVAEAMSAMYARMLSPSFAEELPADVGRVLIEAELFTLPAK